MAECPHQLVVTSEEKGVVSGLLAASVLSLGEGRISKEIVVVLKD